MDSVNVRNAPRASSGTQAWGTTQAISHYVGVLVFVGVHLMGLFAVQTGIRWEWTALAVASYYLRMFAVTAGYHRYFAHRAFKTSRGLQFGMAFLAMTSAQKGVLWWAAHHRHHHKYSDGEQDVHSPIRTGFWYSHLGWILTRGSQRTDFDQVKDFARYPEIRLLDRYYLIPPTVYAVVMYVLWGFPGLIWGFFIPTIVLYHCTFFINSLTHMFGRVRYASNDGSKNSFILAVLCCGEGWHNNHHYYQSTVRQGWFWWEVDLSYYILTMQSWMGVVWDLRAPPDHIKANSIKGQLNRFRIDRWNSLFRHALSWDIGRLPDLNRQAFQAVIARRAATTQRVYAVPYPVTTSAMSQVVKAKVEHECHHVISLAQILICQTSHSLKITPAAPMFDGMVSPVYHENVASEADCPRLTRPLPHMRVRFLKYSL